MLSFVPTGTAMNPTKIIQGENSSVPIFNQKSKHYTKKLKTYKWMYQRFLYNTVMKLVYYKR